MWKFLVKQQKIEVLEREVIADHQIAFVNLKFIFDGDWKKFHKVVQFSQCDESYSIVLGFNGTTCHLPAELHVGAVKMSVFGYDAESDTTVRATTVPVTLNIRESGFVGDDDTPIPPTPDLYTQLLQKIAEIQSGVNGKDGLSAYDLAKENGFVGTVSEWLESLKGADGLPGKDEGMTTYSIAKALMNRGVLSPSGKEKWYASTIESILTNEKYKGSALLQKSFTTDFLTKKKKINEGEVPQYYIDESHEAIIDPEDFEQVQLEMARRKKLGKQYSGNSLFAAKLVCADCGCFFGSKVWHSTSKYRRVIWQCNNKFKGQQLCSTPHLYEDEIKQRFVNAFSIYFHSKDLIIDTCQELIHTISDTSAIDKKIEKLSQELSVIENMNRELVIELARSAKRPEDYDERHDTMTKEYDEKFRKFQKLEQKRTDHINRAEALQNMIQQLSETKSVIDTFDDSLWRTVVEKVTVFHDNRMIFQFLDGTEIEA